MRSLASGHTDVQSHRQMDQRLKFSVTIKFLQPLSGFIRIGFKDYTKIIVQKIKISDSPSKTFQQSSDPPER
jgi:hypothetical protein